MSLRKARVKLLRVACICLVLTAVFFGPSRSADSNLAVDVFFHGVGYLCVLAGVILRMWAILYVGAKKPRELTTTGPYSICRNPLYAGTLLLTLGVSLSLENIVMGTFALIVVSVMIAGQCVTLFGVREPGTVAGKAVEHSRLDIAEMGMAYAQAVKRVPFGQQRRRLVDINGRAKNNRPDKTVIKFTVFPGVQILYV